MWAHTILALQRFLRILFGENRFRKLLVKDAMNVIETSGKRVLQSLPKLPKDRCIHVHFDDLIAKTPECVPYLFACLPVGGAALCVHWLASFPPVSVMSRITKFMGLDIPDEVIAANAPRSEKRKVDKNQALPADKQAFLDRLKAQGLPIS